MANEGLSPRSRPETVVQWGHGRLMHHMTVGTPMTRTIALAGIGLLALTGIVQAQSYTSRSDIYGEPRYGVTTRDDEGNTWHTRPLIYGEPQYGTRTTGSDGGVCTTRPRIYGGPQYGSTTTCN